jgi:ATP-binding cassette subfamily B protein
VIAPRALTLREPGLWIAAACAAVAAVLAAVALAAIAVAIRRALAADTTPAELRALALAVGGALILQLVLSAAAARLVRAKLAARAERLRTDTIERLRDVPAAQLASLDAGRAVELLTSGLDEAGEALAGGFDQLFRGAIAACASFAVVAALDWRIALVALAFLPVTAIYLRQSRGISARATPVFARARAEGSSRFFEYVESVPLLRAFGWTSERTRRLAWALDELNLAAFETTIAPISFGTIALFWIDFGFAITLIAGTSFGIAGSSPQTYVLALTLTLGYFAALFDVVDGALRLQDARANVVEVERVLALAAAVPAGSDALPEGTEASTLALEDAGFAFDTRPVLEGLSHRFAERGITAVVGRSGAGKSALAALLAGLRPAATGRVTVGGVDLRSLSRAARARAVTLVFQDTALTDGTVFENIAAGRPGASAADVRDAARTAECDDFLARLPAGIETPVRAGGADFSPGERQRIAIARALLSDAPIVVFDECTASLDPDAERAVHGALEALARTKTVVLITHRLATVRDAPEILVIADRTIAERGTHAELLARGGEYAALWSAYERPRLWHTPSGV